MDNNLILLCFISVQSQTDASFLGQYLDICIFVCVPILVLCTRRVGNVSKMSVSCFSRKPCGRVLTKMIVWAGRKRKNFQVVDGKNI